MVCPQTALVLGIDEGYSSAVVLGVFLAAAAPLVGMYVFTRVLRLRRSFRTETVGPHVVEPVDREYGDQPYTTYRCKYCEREFERKEFFRDADCEEFAAVER
ncbi:hypothetical protein [Halorussus sp. AFM4]|uniref:hypothetical protein n=1 Tax=Halorussus sp. AFM4 TaxID=3421651 RepID=UPI003EBE071C